MNRQERSEWSRCTGAIRKIGKLRVQNDLRRAKTSALNTKLPESLWESVSGGRSSSPGPCLGVKAVDTRSLEGKTRSVSPAGSSAVEDAMAERSNKPCSRIPLKCELRAIAAVHCVAAIVVAVLFVTQHLVRY